MDVYEAIMDPSADYKFVEEVEVSQISFFDYFYSKFMFNE